MFLKTNVMMIIYHVNKLINNLLKVIRDIEKEHYI